MVSFSLSRGKSLQRLFGLPLALQSLYFVTQVLCFPYPTPC